MPPLYPLEWDSAHFGLVIARVDYEGLTPKALKEAAACADSTAIDCLYLLIPASDPAMIAAAADSGFRFADTRLTLGAGLSWADNFEQPDCIRLFCPSDLARLKEIARSSHTGTRFFRTESVELWFHRWRPCNL